LDRFELPPYPRRGRCGNIEPLRTSTLANWLHSYTFERVVSLVIFFNVVFISYATDYAVQHPYDQSTTFITAVETIFQVFYIFELAIKVGVHRLYFFTNKDMVWNILDTVLVAGAIYDMFLTWVGPSENSSGSGFSVTYLRILRILRLSKVIRVFKVMRFFTELNVLLRVIISTMRPLFWCTFMLAVFYYIFAVVFTFGAASYLALDDVSDAKKAKMVKYYGSVLQAMISLYKASTGGADWGEIAHPLEDAGHFYYSLFLFFIAFVILALLNILTGLFVDRAMKGVAEDKDGMVLERLHSDRVLVTDLCRLFCGMTGEDLDGDSTISETRFINFLRSPVARARLSVLGMDIWDSAQFFQLLVATSGADEIDLQGWVTGCMQLRGFAKRLSMQHVLTECAEIKTMLKALTYNQTRDIMARNASSGRPSRGQSAQQLGVQNTPPERPRIVKNENYLIVDVEAVPIGASRNRDA